MDGITTTRQIIEADKSARIIILTYYDQPCLRESAQAASACAYASKENLIAVRELIDKET
jgi:DNA-binding NarL/FixJ family response regulator